MSGENMKKFALKIITPEKTIFDEEVVEVILPTKDGVVGILADHVPYIAPLHADELLVYKTKDKADDVISFAVDFGLAEFADNQLLVLVAEASEAASIDLAMAEAAKKRASELMKQTVSDEDYANALALIERETAKIKVASKYRLKRRVS